MKDYHFVSQGKTTIPGLDDGEEFTITDVSVTTTPVFAHLEFYPFGANAENIACKRKLISQESSPMKSKHWINKL